jgi:hypothetical protein
LLQLFQTSLVGWPCLMLWYVHLVLPWWVLILHHVPNLVIVVSLNTFQGTYLNMPSYFLCFFVFDGHPLS